VSELNREPEITSFVHLPGCGHCHGNVALRFGLFCQQDSGAAINLIARDKEVDELNRHVHRELSSYMVKSRPHHPLPGADGHQQGSRTHRRPPTNIAEEVVYLYEARDIRHGGDSLGIQRW